MRTYRFEHFTLEYNEEAETVTTKFQDGTQCEVFTNPDHHFHGKITGIKGVEYNLLHELGHHMVALAYGEKWCPIVYASAHRLPMPENAEILEWIITSVSYVALSKPMRDVKEWGAIMRFAEVCNPMEVANRLGLLVYGFPVLGVQVHPIAELPFIARLDHAINS